MLGLGASGFGYEEGLKGICPAGMLEAGVVACSALAIISAYQYRRATLRVNCG